MRTVSSLWRNPDFVKLWVGQTVSKFGSHITYAAVAATAILLLRATPAQMGLLGAIDGAALLVFGLFAGVWVDRLRRRPILIATDIGRALVLASVPIAWMLRRLTMEQLYVVAGLVGVMTVFFGVADRSALPALVQREELVEANARLGASDSVAEIGGQALGGTLVQLITAPLTIFFDSLSYLFSALCIGLIRAPEPPPAHHQERQSVRYEIVEGLHIVAHSPILRALAGSAAVSTFFGSFIGALYWLYLVRELHMTPAFVGAWVGVGGIGSLLGALLTERITRRVGMGPALVGASLYASAAGIYIPLVHGPVYIVIPILLAGQLITDVAWPICEVNAMSLRQAIIPHRLLGRANASMDFLTRGLAPVGAFVGGVLGGVLGLRPTLWIAWAGILCANLLLVLSPIRTLRLPPPPEEAALQTQEH